MKIAGVQKTTLIDYPNHIASIIFTQGCNFACPYCHNSDLIPFKNQDNSYYSIENILDFLDLQKEFIDGVVITGGEPTLQQGLKDFISKIKAKDLKVKLDTNGCKPKLINQLIDNQLLDYIAMDVKSSFANSQEIIGKDGFESVIRDSIDLIKNSNINYEFRTTVVPTLHDKKEIKKIAKLVEGAKYHYLQNFKAKNTLDSKLMDAQGFPPAKLKEFKEILLDYVEKVYIRN